MELISNSEYLPMQFSSEKMFPSNLFPCLFIVEKPLLGLTIKKYNTFSSTIIHINIYSCVVFNVKQTRDFNDE